MIAVRFPDIESARRAALGLEHHGHDGSTIEVQPVMGEAAAATPTADRRIFGRLLVRAVVGGAVAAVVLAVLVVVIVLALDVDSPELWLVAGLAGAIVVGSVLGGFYNALWMTPMSHDTLEVMAVQAPGPAEVVVTSPDADEEARAERLLREAVQS